MFAVATAAPFNAVQNPWFYNGDVARAPYFALDVSILILRFLGRNS